MKKKLSLLLLPLFALVSLFSWLVFSSNPTQATEKSQLAATDQVAAIVKRGTLRVGVKQDVPNFGYRDPETNEYTGLEIEIAKKVADELGVAIELTPVTAQTRGALLDNGQLDMVAATFTITEERKKLYNFTTPYYTDANGFLVKKTSGISSWEDLNGKTIGVTQGSIQQGLLTEIAADKGISLNFTELGSNPEVVVSLAAQRVDAFSIDQSILSGFTGKSNEILDLSYNPSQYGIVTKLSNTDLNAYLDALVMEWEADGTLQSIYDMYGLKPTSMETD
ncbi:transporter substrate-binding domain-containing protein [Streptococcus moroccensis]|uniref:Glutamine transport system substrate-binding protein n=1 Tax=Streptococcus moroccensis TaxID=1451356 RepID=A0ABT9YU30_9STRE|nr:transporter substrate-binding domain-containing protein [Streptococcus moroccensis]MDQ0223501.1 putative glutamine transport system substrate-binding protein [Streptococcus moroccensis]